MRYLNYVYFGLLGCLSYVAAEDDHFVTITLGAKENFSITRTITASPTGENIAVEINPDSDEGGIDIYLGPELQREIQDIVKETCPKELNSDCFNKIRELIDQPHTGLNARDSAAFGFSAISALLGVSLPVYKDQPPNIHVPKRVYGSASLLPEATKIVLVPDEDTTITIDPSPAETTMHPPTTATVTTYIAGATGHAKGDVGIIIPAQLAKDLNEHLQKESTANCVEAASFDRNFPNDQKVKRQFSDLAETICGTETSLAVGAISVGFLQVMGTQVPPRIKGDAIRAMNMAVLYVRNSAALFALTTDQAKSLAEFIYPLVWLKMVFGTEIGEVNIIPADNVENNAVATATECTTTETATNCDVGCRFFGAIMGCSTACSETEACTATAGMILTTNIDPWTPVGRTITIPVATAATTTTASSTPPSAASDPAKNTPGPAVCESRSRGAEDSAIDAPYWNALDFCYDLRVETAKSGMSPIRKGFELSDNQNIHFTISWIEDCDGDEQDIYRPADDKDPNCVSIIDNVLTECDEAIGGYGDFKCVRYAMKVTSK